MPDPGKPHSSTICGRSLDLAKWEAYNRLTENRWQAAVSKVGNGATARSAALTLLCDEVEAEAREAAPKAFAALSPAEQQAFSDYVRSEAERLA